MNHFVDKNAVFDIVMAVRDERLDHHVAIKEIFKVLLSLHGSVGVVDGELAYIPNRYAYLDYVDRTSSIIMMGSGGEAMSREMRIAYLEDAQEWETRVGEQICSQVNDAFVRFSIEDRMLYLEQHINGMTVKDISAKYNIGRKKIYERTKKLRGALVVEFNLKPRSEEEKRVRYMLEAIKKFKNLEHQKACQEYYEYLLLKIEWEKMQ